MAISRGSNTRRMATAPVAAVAFLTMPILSSGRSTSRGTIATAEASWFALVWADAAAAAAKAASRLFGSLAREIWAIATPRRIAVAIPKAAALSSSNGFASTTLAARAAAVPRSARARSTKTTPRYGSSRGRTSEADGSDPRRLIKEN